MNVSKVMDAILIRSDSTIETSYLVNFNIALYKANQQNSSVKLYAVHVQYLY